MKEFLRKKTGKISFISVLLLVAITAMAARIGDNNVKIGDENSSNDKTFLMGDGRFKWDGSESVFKFSNDAGDIFKTLGVGDDSADGVNTLKNPNFENGLSNWTASTPAQFTKVDSTGVLEGNVSAQFDPASQNDEVASDQVNIQNPDIAGGGCQAEIRYTGGDENISLEIVNANDTIIASEILPTHDVSAKESVFFNCPSDTQISGDANLGLLEWRLRQTTVTDAAAIIFDKTYLGTNKLLTQTQLPDTLTARIDLDGSVISETSDFIVGDCSKLATGRYSCDISNLGLTATPGCQVTVNTSASTTNPHPIDCSNVSTTGFEVVIQNNGASTGVFEDNPFTATVVKQGADSTQRVQALKQPITRLQVLDDFTARIVGSNGAVQKEGVDWINGDCTKNSTGNVTCTFTTDLFSEDPRCFLEPEQDVSSEVDTRIRTTTPTTVTYETRVAGSLADVNTNIHCTRQTPSVPVEQIIFPNLVTSPVFDPVVNGDCRVDNSGAVSVNSSSGLCESWIDSLSLPSTGTVSVVFITNTFSADPVCQCTAVNPVDGVICSIDEKGGQGADTSGLTAFTTNDAGTLTNSDFYLSCDGKQ